MTLPPLQAHFFLLDGFVPHCLFPLFFYNPLPNSVFLPFWPLNLPSSFLSSPILTLINDGVE